MKKKKQTKLFVFAGLLVLLIVLKVSDGNTLIFLLAAAGIFLIVRAFTGGKKVEKATEELPLLTKDKESHYAETGMSKREVDFFRETMNATKQQIVQLQENINQNAKLKAIDLRHDVLRASKALFKELVKEPQKLPAANHFLYTHLPNIVDLTNKYNEISSHEIKSKEAYEKLEESAQIIDQMAELIAKDYQQFVADDLDDIDVEISIAKQSLKRDNKVS